LAKRGKALFKSVCLGKCKSRDLPAKLNLTGIAPEMNRLWDASVRELASGVVREHAALLVWERESLRLANIVEGADDEVEPDFQLSTGQRFAGTFHTHPYVSGLMGIAFSGEDFAITLMHCENLSLLHCGNKIVALARTQFTPKFLDDEMIDNKAKELVRTYRRQLSLSDAVLQMNIAFCKRYHFGFYSGSVAGKLRLEFRP